MPSKPKTKTPRSKKAVARKAPPQKPTLDAADAEIAALWKKVAGLSEFVHGLEGCLIDQAHVARRLDAFVDAIRPGLPSEAGDEAAALKAAIKRLLNE